MLEILCSLILPLDSFSKIFIFCLGNYFKIEKKIKIQVFEENFLGAYQI